MGWIKNNLALSVAILLCIICNEFTLLLFDKNPPLDTATINDVRFFNLVLLVVGYGGSRYGFGRESSVVIVAALIPVLLFEIALRVTTVFDQIDRPAPSYIPPYLSEVDRSIDHNGGYITQDNFRTWDDSILHLRNSLVADKGCKIVTLGDSFVMGDGLKAEQTWPGKLQGLTECTVYPFGRNGWTSLEQFDYYEKHLKDLTIDYVIVGVVSNDPQPRGAFCGSSFSSDAYQRRHFSIIKSTGWVGRLLRHSYSVSYMDQVIDGAVTPLFEGKGSLADLPIISWGGADWEGRLYERDVYDAWLSSLQCFVNSAVHPVGFLLTPTSTSKEQAFYFSKIEASLESLDIMNHNTYPKLVQLIGPERKRSDWANLADRHPGERQTALYAQEALLLLKKIGYAP